jgi:type 1 glutamine amidotransferase
MKRLIVLLTALAALLAGPALARSGAKPRVLYLTQSVGFRHAPVIRPDGGLAPSEVALTAIAKESGAFTVETTQDAATITPDKLKSIDVLVFYTTGALPISAESWKAIQDWVASGKGGFIGLHSAADTGWDYAGPGQTYTQFVGGKFAGHPWTQGTPIIVSTVAPHATTAAWPPRFAYAEEIYQYSDFDPASTRVLQALDFAGTPLKRPYLVPLSWVKSIGRGRLAFTNLGHTPSTFDDPRFRAEIIATVKWVAGKGATDAKPNPRDQALWAMRSLLAYDGRGVDEIDARAARLAKADPAWLEATAARIAALRPVFPGKPDSDRTKFDAAYAPLLAEVLARSAP